MQHAPHPDVIYSEPKGNYTSKRIQGSSTARVHVQIGNMHNSGSVNQESGSVINVDVRKVIVYGNYEPGDTYQPNRLANADIALLELNLKNGIARSDMRTLKSRQSYIEGQHLIIQISSVANFLKFACLPKNRPQNLNVLAQFPARFKL
jgi:hypothetical protein